MLFLFASQPFPVYALPMMKTALLWTACLAPVLFGVKVYADAVALHDDHVMVVARCMSHKIKTLDISSQEAYLLCEKEAR